MAIFRMYPSMVSLVQVKQGSELVANSNKQKRTRRNLINNVGGFYQSVKDILSKWKMPKTGKFIYLKTARGWYKHIEQKHGQKQMVKE